MTDRARRSTIASMLAILAALPVRRVHARDARTQTFIDKAFAMKRLAEANGDQSYGAVVVRGEEIVGFGPSNVKGRGEWVGHAEREAIRDAQAKLGQANLSGCVMYSTSRPCSECERAAAQARLARMYFGAQATDAGVPRKS